MAELDFVLPITAICDTNEKLFDWYTLNFDSIKLKTTNNHDLLASADVDAIYCIFSQMKRCFHVIAPVDNSGRRRK